MSSKPLIIMSRHLHVSPRRVCEITKLCLPLIQISSIKIKRFLYRLELKSVTCCDMNTSTAKTTFIFNIKNLKQRHNLNSFPLKIPNKTGIINFAVKVRRSRPKIGISKAFDEILTLIRNITENRHFCPALLLKWVKEANLHHWKA